MLAFAADADVSALLLAGVLPVDAQPASRLALRSMANKELLLGFIDDLHLTGHGRGIVIVNPLSSTLIMQL